MDWTDIARRELGLTYARLENCSETGESATIKIMGVIKISPDLSELELLQKMEWALGLNYGLTFPQFRYLGEISGKHMIELEYVGDKNLEEMLIGNYSEANLIPSDIIGQAMMHIIRMAGVRPVSGEHGYADMFLSEVADGLENNVFAAGLTVDFPLGETFSQRVKFIPTLCHRDFSVTNFMYNTDGDTRLIDPRQKVPGAKVESCIYGSAAIDCASFLVSLERKELERAHLGMPSLGLYDLFEEKMKFLMGEGLFNEFMYNLCIAYSYSIYAACRCEYCLAPERRWLYELMRKRLVNSIRRII